VTYKVDSTWNHGTIVDCSFCNRNWLKSPLPWPTICSQGSLPSHHIADPHQFLFSSDLKPGDRILLIYPPSLDFILSFIACLKARLTAVPLFPPDPRRLDKALTMFHAVTISCGAHSALTSASYNHTAKIASLKVPRLISAPPCHSSLLQSFLPLNPTIQWPDLSWIVTDSLISKAKQLSSYSPTVSWKSRDHSSLAPSSPIFLQFASGSSSGQSMSFSFPPPSSPPDPRGVIITEDNLDHNLSLIARSLQTNTNTVCASWLPQYHDVSPPLPLPVENRLSYLLPLSCLCRWA
jgi:acyl-CoA synthetase (AMP-forming)/AMP-acid ligase II